MRRTFEDALGDLIQRYREDGDTIDEIVSALELHRMALNDEQPED